MIELLEFCKTHRQTAIVQGRIDGKSWSQLAKELDADEGTLRSGYRAVRKRAAEQGISPEHDLTKPVPEGFKLRGTSTLYDGDGRLRAQWVKTQADKQTPEALAQLVKEALEDYQGAGKSAPKPKKCKEAARSLVVYPQGDPHLGMYAWSDETGNDFDLDIATANLVEAMGRLVDLAPSADTAIILNLGDFFHADDSSNRTARNSNALDVDTRWGRVYKAGIQAMIQCVDSARRKHHKVIVKNLIGNHDDHTSQTLAFALDAYFAADKRVQVDTSPAKFWYYQHGQVLIGAGHGDTARPDLLPNIMAADEPERWGSTKHRYWYTGHIHSQNVKEYAGVIWESFKTLAGKDAWHAAQGYRSGRDMYCIVHHEDYGEVERHRVDVSMLGGTHG